MGLTRCYKTEVFFTFITVYSDIKSGGAEVLGLRKD